MISAIIIDDEPNCIKSLRHDLDMFCPQVTVMADCKSAREGIAAIEKFQPDLVFLDVEMPVMNGFDMLEALQPVNFQVIFITAHDRFAVRAFRVSAVDFLTKPVDSHELADAVEKVAQRARVSSPDAALLHLLENIRLPEAQQRLTVPVRDGYELIPVADIIYCKAVGAYTEIVLTDKKLLSSRSLGITEQSLSTDTFERIHHSVLINIHRVKRFKKTEGSSIIMDNGDELAVARARKARLMLRLGIKY